MTKEQGTLFDDLPGLAGPLHQHPLYDVWNNMRQRCHNPGHPAFRDYGGRGIFVCDEWRGSSLAFVSWAVNSGWRAGLEIDRENNDGPYSPGNCRFVTRKRNKRNCRNTVRGPDGSALADHAERLGLSRSALLARLRRGMGWQDAVSIPKGGKRPAASAPAIPAGLVDLSHVDLPRPLPCPGYPAGFAKELKND